MPDVRNIAGEQIPGLTPVGPVIVQHLAGTFCLGGTCLITPAGIVFYAVGRVGDHQQRLCSVQDPLHIGSNSRVAAKQSVISQQPQIARAADRIFRWLRNIIFTLDRAIADVGILKQSIQIFVGDAKQRQVEILGQQPGDFIPQDCLVPVAHLSQLVVRDPVGAPLRLIEMTQTDHRYFR